LNLSTKELIVAAITIPLKISKGVASLGLCQLAELSVILPAFRWSGQSGLGRTVQTAGRRFSAEAPTATASILHRVLEAARESASDASDRAAA
jgi:hypothetical protein